MKRVSRLHSFPPFTRYHRKDKNQVTLPLLDIISKTLCVMNIVKI